VGAPLGSLEWGLSTDDLHVEEGSGDRHLSPYEPQWESWGGVHLLGTLIIEEGLWKWSISLWEFCEGNLEGEILYWRPEGSVEKSSEDRHLSP